MSENVLRKTYHYNAHGHVLSGQFYRPVEHLIEVQAASSLPTIGGHGSARIGKFQFDEFVSFEAAYSYVSGSENKANSSYTTLATAVIEGLNILDVVTADRVVARLASRQTLDEQEPQIIPLGSTFDNLRIAGCPVETDLNHDLFLRLNTFEAIRKELETNAEFRKMSEDAYATG